MSSCALSYYSIWERVSVRTCVWYTQVLCAHEVKFFTVYQIWQLLIILPSDFFLHADELTSQVFMSYLDS